MKVVNFKHERYTVYIGRAGKGMDGYWGNPVKINEECPMCKSTHVDRGSTLPCYESYLRKRLEASAAFKQSFLALAEDDILGCFCKPDACHGDVMVKVWTELSSSQKKT